MLKLQLNFYRKIILLSFLCNNFLSANLNYKIYTIPGAILTSYICYKEYLTGKTIIKNGTDLLTCKPEEQLNKLKNFYVSDMGLIERVSFLKMIEEEKDLNNIKIISEQLGKREIAIGNDFINTIYLLKFPTGIILSLLIANFLAEL